jgi:hypothetical protein
MGPDLVDPTRRRPAFQPYKPAEGLEPPEGRLAGHPPPLPENPHAPALVLVLVQAELDGELGRQASGGIPHPGVPRGVRHRWQHRDQGEVDLLHPLGLELAAQHIEGRLGLGAEEHAARGGVEAVHIGHLGPEGGPDRDHQVAGRPVDPVRADRHAARLVEGDQGIVLVEDGRQ